MSFYVLWKGLFRDEYATFEQARKHALLAVGAAPGWSPTQRRLNPLVRIVGEDGAELETFPVAGELERIKSEGLTAEE